MADEYIKVGSTFTVTCDTTPLTNLSAYSNPRVYYRRPDGKRGYLTPDSATDSTLVATVSTTLNPLTVASGDPKWRDGYPGVWEFYPYVQGPGAIEFHGEEAFVHVHPQFRDRT